MRKPGPQGPLLNLEKNSKNGDDSEVSQEMLFNFSSPLSKDDRR